MDTVSYEEATFFVEKFRPELESQLKYLQKLCQDNAVEVKKKIYLSKYRVKNPESIYLKSKRKGRSLNDINDFGGLRLLCMFEQDIPEIHDYFIRLIAGNEFNLIRCSVYNWDDKLVDLIKLVIDEKFDTYEFENQEKKSGYKSVHYIVKRNGISSPCIEVQLRTLVQDVWGELEHSISYKKGGVHPHIKKSFSLLSKDLANIDNLLTYLKEVNEKELSGEYYSNKTVVPKYYFKYEKELIPNEFLQEGRLRDHYLEYWEHIRVLDKKNVSLEWVKEARKKLLGFDGILSKQQSKMPGIEYWLEMEDAFILFCEAQHEKSLKVYMNLLEKYPDKYCVHFRIGELYYLLNDVEKALNSFDKAEGLLLTTCEIDYVNHYRIKSKLAYIYWSLGEEYAHISVQEIMQANEIYIKNKASFDDAQYEQLINNICWYKLENYIVISESPESADKVEAAFDEVFNAYKEIEKKLSDPNVSSNLIDTAAWYNFWVYKKTGEKKYLDVAKEYCVFMKDKAKYTSYPFRSMKLHINHVQSIMSAR